MQPGTAPILKYGEWAGHGIRTGEARNAFIILLGKPFGIHLLKDQEGEGCVTLRCILGWWWWWWCLVVDVDGWWKEQLQDHVQW
jgi:hypothetical protein